MQAQIELPRLPEESAKAYAARAAYVTMGPERSLDKLRQQYGKTAAYTRQLEVWSSRFDWQEHARRYDDTLAGIQAQQAAQQYLAALHEHRERYQRVGKALYAVAMAMLADLNAQRADIKPNGNSLATISKALTTAADLEAHALGLDHLLGTLTPPDEP